MTLGALGVLLQAMLSVSKNIVRIFIFNSTHGTLTGENTSNTKGPVYFFADIPFKRFVQCFILNYLEKG